MKVLSKCLCHGLVVILALSAGACASLLGVDEAQCDPDFDPTCSGGTDPERDAASDAAAAVGGQDTTPPTKEELCAEYCVDIATACAEFPQYLNESGCRVVCNGMLPLADEGEGLLDDTLQCRVAAVRNATNFNDDVRSECAAAGPMGIGCGDECEKYCDYMDQFCPEEFVTLEDNCVEDCRGVPRKSSYIHTDKYDNSLECRFIHIQLSIQDSPGRVTHCGHAAGDAPCVGEIEE